jgi:3-dehydroquinate synthase
MLTASHDLAEPRAPPMLPRNFRPAHVHEQRFSVPFVYPVVFCRRALTPGDKTLAWAIGRNEPERRHSVYAVADGGLVSAQPDLGERLATYVAHDEDLDLVAPLRTIPGGESAKNSPDLVATLQAEFARARLDRHAVVLAIGGGAVLDAVGYAAATTHRGVRVVRMPSTVLAQNDAGVGVKNGINAFGAKNFLGTFAPPYAVVNDGDLLRTLPLRDARAGMAEAVKVALIRDADFFAWIEENAALLGRAAPEPLEVLIRRCADLHLRHIAGGGDPFETGSARPLDYGHWSAHKLEILSGHELRHGEAVAIGMALDARYAVLQGALDEATLARICGLLETLGLPTFHPALQMPNGRSLAVLQGLQQFREHLGGPLTITLVGGVGRAFDVQDVDEGRMVEAISWLAARRQQACDSPR